MVALVTLTHSVRVRILFPLPNKNHSFDTKLWFFFYAQNRSNKGIYIKMHREKFRSETAVLFVFCKKYGTPFTDIDVSKHYTPQ